MHHNEVDGLIAHDRAVVDLHGTKTDIHSNKRGGIHADDRAKVNIHLLCLPNTMHPMTMLEEIEIIPTSRVEPSPTSTPTVHSHT